jgi:hypothetical protein
VTPVGGPELERRFVFDVGSGLALALHSPFVAEQKLLGRGAPTIRAIGAGGAGGKTRGQIGRVAELRIGPFRIPDPVTMFSEDTAGAFANASLAGNIGAQIAIKFRLFFDYARNRLILEPSTAFGEPFDRASAGMAVRAFGADYRTFRIVEILERSPAAEAMLQTDDVILAVDGKPAADFTLTNLIGLFETPVTYRLTVRRGEQTLEVPLTPRRLV